MGVFETYEFSVVSTIPLPHLKTIVSKFLFDASLDMGQEFDDEKFTNRVVEIISKNFAMLPMHVVHYAFQRGALGAYGAGRLVPRTIHGWLTEVQQWWVTKETQEKDNVYKDDSFKGLHRYPLGKAIIKKMDLTQGGAISLEDWEKMPLMDVADRISKGLPVTPEVYGLKDRRDERT